MLRLTLTEKAVVPGIRHQPSPALCRSQRVGRISAVLVSVRCFVRGVPFFFAATPQTPLRVLCMMAFDTLHMLRNSQPLPRPKLHALAALLDFGACANAVLDGKSFCAHACEGARLRLENAGHGRLVDDYVTQLRNLERRRPSLGGDHQQWEDVRLYRESVARLSLGIIAATALGDGGAYCENGGQAIHNHEDLEILFRIVMQCQIIDDVLDYAKDASAGLPSFLTASASLPQAAELTALAAGNYANVRTVSSSAAMCPLRMALCGASSVAKLIIRFRHPRDEVCRVFQHPDNPKGLRKNGAALRLIRRTRLLHDE